ncbi:MAG TPA: NAD-dependent epimerase/dehydratase family protein [Acidobacteriaceae bacterium]
MYPKPHTIVGEDVARIAATPLPWEKLFGKTVLITGANGFVPAYMLETLLYLNETAHAEVRILALVRNPERAMRRLGHVADRPDVSMVVQDVREEYRGERVDFIIHAASQASPRFYGEDPVGTFEANVLGTRRMLEVARNSGSEGFLFFSSGEVYGRVEKPEIPVKETDYGYLDPLNVRSCYGEGKRAGETLCTCWHAQYGIPARIVRLSHTYGPGMDLSDGRVFADFVADVVAGRDIVMKSDGSARRPFCYLADATAAFFMVLLCGEEGGAYNVGSDVETSVLDLAETLAGLFPERHCRVIRKAREGRDQYMPSTIAGGHFDLARIRALGWKPTTGIEEGFRRTVLSYQ